MMGKFEMAEWTSLASAVCLVPNEDHVTILWRTESSKLWHN